ncbi:hypothetical protein HNR23_004082 [Nocardiopsis mwathae]|uniref:Uncharacterized protein n=1 Tax=Nocardiopsis mwathae TaxID=1472723 RepID=A0A7W9YL25_9ACTN|nr:hypothetical protein [Nocardiopsis mwathae]MBB6174022.1 hypothetical protein [Nocardiopsis mwathae]
MTPRWGHSPEHADAHATAARFQAEHSGTVVWFGETSGHFYVLDRLGLHDYATLAELTAHLRWRHRRSRSRSATALPQAA